MGFDSVFAAESLDNFLKNKNTVECSTEPVIKYIPIKGIDNSSLMYAVLINHKKKRYQLISDKNNNIKYSRKKVCDYCNNECKTIYSLYIENKNIKSEGITKGSIQVPGDGQPIILLSDHPTIGGYPKIANVITADYDKLVQKIPGTTIKFKLVDLPVAEKAFQEYVRKF